MLIIGLGNPEGEYGGTRHNVGSRFVRTFVKQLGISLAEQSKLLAEVGKSGETTFAAPQTYMNNSGQAARAVMDWYKLAASDVVVIHDDLDVPLGEVRVKFGGGAAGHNGVDSVAHHLSTPDFWRIRVGIGPEDEALKTFRTTDTSGFVLSKFDETERKLVEQVENMVCSRIPDWLIDPQETNWRQA